MITEATAVARLNAINEQDPEFPYVYNQELKQLMKYEVSDDEDLKDNDSDTEIDPLPPIDLNDLDFWDNKKLAKNEKALQDFADAMNHMLLTKIIKIPEGRGKLDLSKRDLSFANMKEMDQKVKAVQQMKDRKNKPEKFVPIIPKTPIRDKIKVFQENSEVWTAKDVENLKAQQAR